MKELSPTGCKPGTIYRTIGLIGIFAAFAQISLGGFVRASGSGLGCPDWPLCHGEIIPTFEYHTIIEYSHRALGSILGLLVILLLASTLIFYRKNRWLLYWNISAFMLVVLAGVLGGITVITELVWWVRLIHLAIAQCVIASLAVILWQAFEVKPPSTATYSSIGNWKNKIINIHPSLLPKYKGLNTHKRVLKSKEKYSGCTVHFVTPKLDSGKIILQKKVLIDKNETEISLKKKILLQEHKLYSQSIISLFK